MTFKDLQLIKPILKAINDLDYDKPSQIQSQAIPILLSGKDLLASAQTGTGKTAAFAIPILQKLAEEKQSNNKDIKALILAPTRELAAQIGSSFRDYGKYMNLKVAIIFGGVPQRRQVFTLKKGVDILIATPGRLLDLIGQRIINIRNIKYFVLDEADRMMDMGFIIDVKKIVAKMNTTRQTMLFSATLPNAINELAKTILNKPEKIAINPTKPTIDKINQALFYVKKENKLNLLLSILKTKVVTSALVFVRTKYDANRLTKELNNLKINAAAIHGDKEQRQRTRALNDFKTKKVNVLVATDIASRGIDIDELSHVINFNLPEEAETYIHRIGRTGRAGLGGTALSFCGEGELHLLKYIEKHINMKIKVVENHPFAIKPEMISRKKPQRTKRNRNRKKPYHKHKRKY